MAAQIINLTPHAVVLLNADDEIVANYEPSGTIARAAQSDEHVTTIEVAEGVTCNVVRTTFGKTTDLPDPDGETHFVVSILTAQAAKAGGRSTNDLLVTSDPVRGEDGRIIGCRRFAVV